jgi:hypothetical protein
MKTIDILAIIWTLLIPIGIFYLSMLIKSNFIKQNETLKTLLFDESTKKQLIGKKMISLYDELLVLVGSFKSLSFGQKLNIVEPIGASDFNMQILKLALFSETWWPYFGDELRENINSFRTAIAQASKYDSKTNTTQIEVDIFWEKADNLQKFIRKDIDRNFGKKNS